MLNRFRTYIAAAVIGVLAAGLIGSAGGCFNANVDVNGVNYGKSADKDKAIRQAKQKVESAGMDPDRYKVTASPAQGQKNAFWVMFDTKSDATPRADKHLSVLVDSEGKATLYRSDNK